MVDLYDRGMCEPLPIYCDTSAAYAQACRDGADPIDASRGEWQSTYDFAREDREPEHMMVLGGERPFDDLQKEQPRPNECGPGWKGAEESRFGRLACRLWDDLLGHEQMREG